MEALKGREESLGILGIEADAVVANVKRGFAIDDGAAHFDDGWGAWASVLESIGEEIRESLFHQAEIAPDDGQGCDTAVDFARASV
jgi:hypothetical protein